MCSAQCVCLMQNITAAQVVKRVHSSTHEQDEQILCSVGVNRWDFVFMAVTQIISAFIPCSYSKLHRTNTDILEKVHV